MRGYGRTRGTEGAPRAQTLASGRVQVEGAMPQMGVVWAEEDLGPQMSAQRGRAAGGPLLETLGLPRPPLVPPSSLLAHPLLL